MALELLVFWVSCAIVNPSGIHPALTFMGKNDMLFSEKMQETIGYICKLNDKSLKSVSVLGGGKETGPSNSKNLSGAANRLCGAVGGKAL
ncbi:MAG: hypothetical protein MR762_13175 [Clostridiales bacterium]|nr:hypothetical protein [Clostridiales bacterium]